MYTLAGVGSSIALRRDRRMPIQIDWVQIPTPHHTEYVKIVSAAIPYTRPGTRKIVRMDGARHRLPKGCFCTFLVQLHTHIVMVYVYCIVYTYGVHTMDRSYVCIYTVYYRILRPYEGLRKCRKIKIKDKNA